MQISKENSTPRFFITDWEIYNCILCTLLNSSLARSKESGNLKVILQYINSMGQILTPDGQQTEHDQFDKFQTTIIDDGISLNDAQIKMLEDYLKRGKHEALQKDIVLQQIGFALKTCKDLTEALKGTIEIKSQEDMYTAITFTVKTFKNHDQNTFIEPMEHFETINLSDESQIEFDQDTKVAQKPNTFNQRINKYSMGNDVQHEEIIRNNEIQLQIIEANNDLDQSHGFLLPTIRGRQTNRGDYTDRQWLQELNDQIDGKFESTHQQSNNTVSKASDDNILLTVQKSKIVSKVSNEIDFESMLKFEQKSVVIVSDNEFIIMTLELMLKQLNLKAEVLKNTKKITNFIDQVAMSDSNQFKLAFITLEKSKRFNWYDTILKFKQIQSDSTKMLICGIVAEHTKKLESQIKQLEIDKVIQRPFNQNEINKIIDQQFNQSKKSIQL